MENLQKHKISKSSGSKLKFDQERDLIQKFDKNKKVELLFGKS